MSVFVAGQRCRLRRRSVSESGVMLLAGRLVRVVRPGNLNTDSPYSTLVAMLASHDGASFSLVETADQRYHAFVLDVNLQPLG